MKLLEKNGSKRATSKATSTKKSVNGSAKRNPRFGDCPPGEDGERHAAIIEKVLGMIGGKWKVLIVFHLGTSEVCRFGELRKKIPGVTQKMLTMALREMEQDGIVERKVYAEVPPRVEYRLTEEGGDLKEIYIAVAQWGLKHGALLDRRTA